MKLQTIETSFNINNFIMKLGNEPDNRALENHCLRLLFQFFNIFNK